MSHTAIHAMRRRLIEALETQAAAHDGELRRVLEEKLSRLREIDTTGPASVDIVSGNEVPVRGALGLLVDDMSARASFVPEADTLESFRKIWSRVRTHSHLAQSMEEVPENAGPLNSSALVHRSIALMRELSPGYLQQFLSYVDDLSWMEQLGSSVVAGNDVPRIASPKKRSRSKPRAS